MFNVVDVCKPCVHPIVSWIWSKIGESDTIVSTPPGSSYKCNSSSSSSSSNNSCQRVVTMITNNRCHRCQRYSPSA